MEEGILNTTHRLFTTNGIHQFTMDELANRLGISKKTLYRFFPSRQDLVEQVCNKVNLLLTEEIEAVANKKEASLDMLLSYIRTIVGSCKTWNPQFFIDLQKHYPVQWLELTQSINSIVLKHIRNNLEKGISEGVYRGNIHPELLITIWQQHLQADFRFADKLVNDYSKDEIFRQAMYLFLYGIISVSAVPLLEEKLSTYSIPQQMAVA